MGAQRAREPASVSGGRFVGIEPLEGRLFFNAALPAAVAADLGHPRSADRTAIIAKAGKTFATAQNVGTLSQTTEYRGTLATASPNAYFKFTVASSATVAMSLTGLSGNADLEFFRAPVAPATQPVEVATSAHPGTTNESIGKKVAAGAYYARVYENSGNVSYMLTLSMSTAMTKTPPPVTTPPAATNTGHLHIVFNYSYDISGFFASHPEAEVLLNQAATAFEKFTNVLTAITPGSGNTWSETFNNPANPNQDITLNNQSIAANTIVIYVGASNVMQTAELGFAAPGGWSAYGSQPWLNNVASRGQAGALAADPTGFGPWGGSISFSDTANWNISTALPGKTQDDFLSVATHEISHVLGFGTSNSWANFISGNNFIGPHAEALNGHKPVPLAPGLQHWANDFESTVNGVTQYCEMDPYLITGTRRAFTALDYAGLEDVGWTL
ncbi:MAG TPA: pre-peptidase C-terminal domain-containing protein [Tepidisphaeraceae bacterium]|jgi:hypothetical protein|nr:pre-peptidase C-terminal domain-containing protein [Tepidisphaeraceae bacterium]